MVALDFSEFAYLPPFGLVAWQLFGPSGPSVSSFRHCAKEEVWCKDFSFLVLPHQNLTHCCLQALPPIQTPPMTCIQRSCRADTFLSLQKKCLLTRAAFSPASVVSVEQIVYK